MGRGLAAVVAAVLLGACGTALPPPEYFTESPVGTGTWTPIPAEPSWVSSPPSREGRLVLVAEGKSNLRRIAASGPHPSAEREAVERVRSALAPVVGEEDAARVAAMVPSLLRMSDRACREEVLTRKMVPGSTLCTAWALWEIPVEPLLAVLPERKREAAREALNR